MLIPFGFQSYQHEARQLSSQRMVNCFLEQEPAGSKSPVAIIRTQGVETLVTLPTSPVRGGVVHMDLPYFVAGGFLYRVSGGTYEKIGPIPGNDRVGMISNGFQLAILANQNLYVFDNTLAQVTDDGYSPASDMTYSDLFGVFAKVNSQDIFITDPGASPFPDFREFNALDFRTVEARPDSIVALESDHRELFIFKEDSTEIWVNTGNADFTFEPIANAFMEIGCIARDSVTRADNTVFWLANDMTVRRADGYTPLRVSTHAIENEITKMSKRDDAFAFSHPFNGHIFYVLTFPTEKRTFVYDITTGLWHERESGGENWSACVYMFAEGIHYVGDSSSGRVGKLDVEDYTDFGNPHRVSVTAPSIHSGGRQLFFRRLHVDFEMGRGVTDGQGEDPQAMLQWSDDGGRTWSSEYWRSIGRIGEYSRRAVWHRLGASRDRVFRLTFSDPSPFTIIQAMADVDIGET